MSVIDHMPTSETRGLRLSLSKAGAREDIHIVRVDGRVDTVTASELDEIIGSLLGRKAYRVVIDLAGAHYISSAGWGVFVSRLRDARGGGGDICLGRMQSGVRDVYDLLEFDGLLSSFDSLEEAVASFTGETPASMPPAETPAPVLRATPTVVAIPPPNGTLESAVLRLIVEDPFYTINELRAHIGRSQRQAPGWWQIWQVLQREKLLRRRRRFRYFRRHRDTGPRSW